MGELVGEAGVIGVREVFDELGFVFFDFEAFLLLFDVLCPSFDSIVSPDGETGDLDGVDGP